MQILSISFGYSHKLKKLYKKGKLPTVVNGFYGGILTTDTVTLEHLKPHSKGGKTVLENLVLATAENNYKRSNKPLQNFINHKAMEGYLNQFKGVRVGNFNGNRYIEKIIKTVKELLNEQQNIYL